jgi:hypothetical protein
VEEPAREQIVPLSPMKCEIDQVAASSVGRHGAYPLREPWDGSVPHEHEHEPGGKSSTIRELSDMGP